MNGYEPIFGFAFERAFSKVDFPAFGNLQCWHVANETVLF